MIKRIFAVILLLLIVVTLCGCADGTEPENRVILTAIGLDEKGGKLILSVESADVISNTNEDIYNSHFTSVAADNLHNALYELENSSYGKIMFSQCPIILIGDSLGSRNLNDFLNFCIEEHEITFSVRLLSCKNAKDILNSDRDKDSLIGYETLKLIEYGNVSGVTDKSDGLPAIFDKKEKNQPFYLPRIEVLNGQLKITESKRMKVNE